MERPIDRREIFMKQSVGKCKQIKLLEPLCLILTLIVPGKGCGSGIKCVKMCFWKSLSLLSRHVKDGTFHTVDDIALQ